MSEQQALEERVAAVERAVHRLAGALALLSQNLGAHVITIRQQLAALVDDRDAGEEWKQ